jgi:hypothetical protein
MDFRFVPLILALLLVALVKLGAFPTGHGGYPPAPSLAGKVSSERRHFIDRVDQTCARTFNAGNARQARYAAKVAGRPDANVLVTAFYVSWHRDEYRQLRALGEPPEARAEYAAWIDNFAERVRLESGYVPFMRAGGTAHVQALEQRVLALKTTGNRLGQRFGLRICTSNGPR